MEDDFNLIQLVEVCGPTESILVRPGEFLFREDDEAQSLIGSRMIRLHTVTEGIALKMLARNGIAAIWQLQGRCWDCVSNRPSRTSSFDH